MRTALPHFLEWGTVPPLFGRITEKNNSDFPSSSAHVSPYNIKENVWRLGLCPRNRVHRRSQREAWGPRPSKGVEKMHNCFSCAKGTNIYVKVLCLVIVNVTAA